MSASCFVLWHGSQNRSLLLKLMAIWFQPSHPLSPLALVMSFSWVPFQLNPFKLQLPVPPSSTTQEVPAEVNQNPPSGSQGPTYLLNSGSPHCKHTVNPAQFALPSCNRYPTPDVITLPSVGLAGLKCHLSFHLPSNNILSPHFLNLLGWAWSEATM